MAKFEEKAKAAQKEGEEKTFGVGSKQPKLSKKQKQILTECEKHRLFIEHVNGYVGKYGDEVDQYCSKVVNAFMESHNTLGLIEQARALMEAENDSQEQPQDASQEEPKDIDAELAERQEQANAMDKNAEEYKTLSLKIAQQQKALEEDMKKLEELRAGV